MCNLQTFDVLFYLQASFYVQFPFFLKLKLVNYFPLKCVQGILFKTFLTPFELVNRLLFFLCLVIVYSFKCFDEKIRRNPSYGALFIALCHTKLYINHQNSDSFPLT